MHTVQCFLIDEVRRTTPLETPNHGNTFFMKTDEGFEIYVDVFSKDELESWLATIKYYQHAQIMLNHSDQSNKGIDQAWANCRSQIFFIQKKFIKIEGCYLFIVGVTSFILK